MGMAQAWTTAGKRLVVTRCRVDNNLVVAKHNLSSAQTSILETESSENQANPTPKQTPPAIFEIGYGKKKLKNEYVWFIAKS